MTEEKLYRGLSPRSSLCVQCGKPFVLDAGEREFFHARGVPEPSRCPDCRKLNREAKEAFKKSLEAGR